MAALAASTVDRELSFPELVAILWRRRWFLALGLALGAGGGLAVPHLITPVYTAQGLILIEPHGVATADGVVPSGPVAVDGGVIDSEVQVLSSRSLARAVIDQLGLEHDAELGGTPATGQPSGGDVVGHFLEHLSVRRAGKSQVLEVAFSYHDPKQAARIVDKLAQLYLEGQIARKLEASRRSGDWLAGQIAAAEGRLNDATRKLEAFRAASEQTRGAGMVIDRERIADLQRQLVLAGAERSGREAQLARLRQALAAGEPVAPADGGSINLQGLESRRIDLDRRRAELEAQLGARHPKMQDLRNEAAALDRRIGQERANLLRATALDVDTARVREQALRKSLEELKAQALAQDEVVRRTAALEREAGLQQHLLESLRDKAGAVADRAAVGEPDARVISDAAPPESPVRPRPRLIFGLGFLVGLTLALVAIYLLEARDGGVRSARELERLLGRGAVALIPTVPGSRPRGIAPHDYALERPRSRYAESLRGLLASCLGPDESGPGRVVLVTSAMPGEGKTTLATSLARLAAAEGLQVLLIDADLRRPALHERLGVPPGPGLVEALRGEVPLVETLRRDPRAPVTLLPSNARLEQPSRLLTGQPLRAVLEGARRRFDLVVVDTAPVLAVADACLLAPRADTVLLLAAWAATPGAMIESAYRALREAGGPVPSPVMTRVAAKGLAAAGAGGLALRRLKRYYAD